MYIRRKVYSAIEDNSYCEKEPQLYSVTMNEDELALFSEFCDGYYESLYSSDEDDDLSIKDKINNALDKNPLTIKKLREIRKNSLSTDPEKNKKARRDATKISAAIGGGTGALAAAAMSGKHGAKAGLAGLAGAAIGTGIGAGAGYLDAKMSHALNRKIRRSAGGGEYDDKMSREHDRLAMLDGEMSRSDFKKKWYRHNQSK